MTELNELEITNVSGGVYQGPVFIYEIKPGDCLSVLAQRYHTTVKVLQELNNIQNPNLIIAGKKLRIPYIQ